MRRSKRLRAIVGIAILAAFGLGCWTLSRRPDGSAQAERLVGTWHHHDGPAPDMPDGTDKFWLLSPDRSCRLRCIDTASGELLGTMAGRWYAADGKLVCDFEESWLVRAERVLPARWRGSHINMIDWDTIESVDDEDLVLRARGGGSNYPLRRVAGR